MQTKQIQRRAEHRLFEAGHSRHAHHIATRPAHLVIQVRDSNLLAAASMIRENFAAVPSVFVIPCIKSNNPMPESMNTSIQKTVG